jgi:DnaK suppressor protein
MKLDDRRAEELRQMLTTQRERVKALRRDQDQEALATPGDTMDVAKTLADVETHATIIEHAEDQLRQIDSALARVDEGRYATCLNCGEEIPIERLEAIPSAIYCVRCQSAVDDKVPQAAAIERESYSKWAPPPEAGENQVLSDLDNDPIEELAVKPLLASDQEAEPTASEEAPARGGSRGRRRGRRS